MYYPLTHTQPRHLIKISSSSRIVLFFSSCRTVLGLTIELKFACTKHDGVVNILPTSIRVISQRIPLSLTHTIHFSSQRRRPESSKAGATKVRREEKTHAARRKSTSKCSALSYQGVVVLPVKTSTYSCEPHNPCTIATVQRREGECDLDPVIAYHFWPYAAAIFFGPSFSFAQ